MRNYALIDEIKGYRRRCPAYQELVRLLSHSIQLEWLLRCKPGKASTEEWEWLWRYLRDHIDPAARRLAELVVAGGDVSLPRPPYVGADTADTEAATYVRNLKMLVHELPFMGLPTTD